MTKYLYLIKDWMAKPLRIEIDETGLITKVGNAEAYCYVEDYGDYLLTDKPCADAWDRWQRASL